MAAGNVARVVKGPGKLIVAPTLAFDGNVFPYDGVQIGLVNLCRLTPVNRPGKRIVDEGSGEVVDVLEPRKEWVFTCMLRGWDDNAVAQFFPGSRTVGAVTQHAVFTVPGTRLPGQSSADSINLVLAFVPDNLIDSDGLMIYRGIPMWTDDAEIAFQAGVEFAIPLQIECLRNAFDHTFRIGRMPDLDLT